MAIKLKSRPSKVEKPKYENLRDVMDLSRDFSMFFSGVENDTYFKGCYEMGVRNFLMSYEYLQSRKGNMHSKYKGLGIKFLIDSGAFTYQNDPKYVEYDKEHWEKHIEKYLSWAEANSDYIFAIANLDLERLVGGDTVQEWNEKYFEPFMLRTGIPVCFVWHSQTSRTWEQYCKRYPYVGFSAVSDEKLLEMSEFKDKLLIAEKYESLVHGFGMTRTGILPQLPFYTVDSVSWKSGFMYGLVALWNGKKVQFVKKEEFETKLFKYTRSYTDLNPPLDEQLIYEYYEPEVLRANVYAYQKAEAFIRECLKSKTYWKKAKSIKRTSVDDVEYPGIEWLKNPDGEWKEIAQSFNVSTEDKETAINCITDITILMNWENPEYTEFRDKVYTTDLLKELHDTWVNRIVSSEEEVIEDLQNFFIEILLGNETKFLYLGTNFDRTVKERDEYVDDTEYEYVDVPDVEMSNFMAKYLPDKNSEAPEIDELDEEIFSEHEIVPVRDSRGRLIKGQKQVKKPKKLYSKKFPKVACDTCFNAQKCPEYKAGYVCAYNKMFDRYDTRDMADIIQAMQGIVDFSLGRLQRGMISEVLNGGVPDPSVTGMMNQSMGLLSQLQKMYEFGSREVLRQTKVLKSDGSQEVTTQVTNPQSGGILEKIFGGMGNNSEEKEPINNEDNIVE